MTVWLIGWQLPVGWSADDGVHMRFSSIYPISKYLLDPELLWIASYANLTPLLNTYYSLNLALFGLDPIGWRSVQVLLAVLAASSLYLGLRAFVRPWPALFAASTWALGVPFFYTAATHMTSHYLLGMVGAGLCVWFFASWVRGGGIGNLLLATFFYALAILSKEVYAPLPALFVLMRPLRKVLWGLLSLGLVAAAYLILRKVVLGTVVGGYRAGRYVGDMDWSALLGQLHGLGILVTGGRLQALLWGATLLILIWLARGRRLKWVTGSALVAAVVLMPLLPLMAAAPLTQPDRYLFVASALTCALVGLAMDQARLAKAVPAGALVITGILLVSIQARSLVTAVPVLAKGLGFQVQVYRHALQHAGPMLIVNQNLPTDVSYWSQVLNAARETKARLAGSDSYDRVMLVSDPQAPVLFGLAQLGIPVYRYDATCSCVLPHKPAGVPTRNPIDVALDRTLLLYLENPARRPENSQSSFGDSTQTLRRIAPDNPKALEISGTINLGTELDWLYMVLPRRELPKVFGTGPTAATGADHDLQRSFNVRLEFDSTELANEAMRKLCISVPAVRKTHYALLQGQPAYCRVFVNDKLHYPQ